MVANINYNFDQLTLNMQYLGILMHHYILFAQLHLLFLKSSFNNMFIDLLEREEGEWRGQRQRERRRERRNIDVKETSISCLSCMPRPGTEPTTLWCMAQCSNQYSHLIRAGLFRWINHLYFLVQTSSGPLLPNIYLSSNHLLNICLLSYTLSSMSLGQCLFSLSLTLKLTRPRAH